MQCESSGIPIGQVKYLQVSDAIPHGLPLAIYLTQLSNFNIKDEQSGW